MTGFDAATTVSALRLGADPAFDAWFYTFRAENNIEHHINPVGVAGREQLAFMAALAEGEIYVPCADAVFLDLIRARRSRRLPDAVLRQYAGAWRIAVALVRARLTEREKRRIMLTYCRHRFQGCLALGCILPSRLVKRLITTFVNQLDGEDPWATDRQVQHHRLAGLYGSEPVLEALNALPGRGATGGTLDALRREIDHTLLARLLFLAARLSGGQGSKQEDETPPDHTPEALSAAVRAEAEAFVPEVRNLLGDGDGAPRTFLYLCDTSGGLVADMRVIHALLAMGHRVVYAIKESPLFLAPVPQDLDHGPFPASPTGDALLMREAAISKNDLLRRLRESRLLVITDGTSELLNFYRTSVTFARAWKECDAVLVKGRRTMEALLGTSTRFTRDVFCFWEEEGAVRMRLKPRAPGVRKFSEADLTARAGNIIRRMRAARDQGKAVMFYSCIIGSIPGQTRDAVRVAETFVEHLRAVMDDVFVINPAEYFEEGMDGDDLMFMWEQVQRSGLITVWRFQSVEDIETSFSLMGRKVPPAWSGKDATFSTGCTKEMRIALDMQRAHPELQIIGPAPDKFLRRGNYGVGKFFDAGIVG